MERGEGKIEEFEGLAHDVHPVRMPPNKFQVDVGGDRFEQGTWKRRRGQRHTDVPQVSSAIKTIIGFELPGGDFGVLLVEGSNAHGFTNVAEQGDDVSEGFGRQPFGCGGFGS